MKSTFLKTLAATSLVATTHAQIKVLGTSFKERGAYAPNGTIVFDPGTVATTRGYLIVDETVMASGTVPNKATYIQYREDRDSGVVTRNYWIDTDFADFRADIILGGAAGGRRIYGHIQAPPMVADVTNPRIPFSGTVLSDNFPRKLTFDKTTFQTVNSDAVVGPKILGSDTQLLRSEITGSANPVRTTATTISGAAAQFIDRLENQGYVRTLAEAPVITTDLPATFPLADGEVHIFTVEISPDAVPGGEDDFPAPTYQWYKDNVAIPTGVTASYTVTGGTSTATNGLGSYRVVIANSFGSATSTTAVVGAKAITFTTNPEPAVTLVGASTATLTATPSPLPIDRPAVVGPPAIPSTYRWKKAATATPTVFTDVPDAAGGNLPSLLVVGAEAATGAGIYRLDVTSLGTTYPSGTSTVTISPAGTAFVFTANLPKTIAAPFASTIPLSATVNTAASPALISRQWYRALPGSATFTAVPDGNGGKNATLQVTGDLNSLTNANGPGTYYMEATNSAGTISTIRTVVTTQPTP